MSEINYYNWDEVSKNNGKDGAKLWIVIKDRVYDVTKFIGDHPGGAELIEEFAGKDATKAFNDNGHSSDARKQLKELEIGALKSETDHQPTHQVGESNHHHQQQQQQPPPSTENEKRSCMSVLSCGLCG